MTYQEQLKKMQVYSEKEKANMRAKRKKEFMEKFMNSDKYDMLRSKIEKPVLQLVHDSFEKDLGLFSNQVGDSDQILSEINIYVAEELEKI